MDSLIFFVAQVGVTLIMLAGMVLGDYITHLLFGEIIGLWKKILYMLSFIVLLVSGNYVTEVVELVDLPLASYFIMPFLLGFFSVLLSRLFAEFVYYLTKFFRALRRKEREHMPSVDVSSLIRALEARGVEEEDITFVLAFSLGSKKKAESIHKKIKHRKKSKLLFVINPCRVAAAAHRIGLSAEDVVDLFVSSYRMSPEKAAFIWHKST